MPPPKQERALALKNAPNRMQNDVDDAWRLLLPIVKSF